MDRCIGSGSPVTVAAIDESEIPVVPMKRGRAETFDPTLDEGKHEVQEEQLLLSLDRDELTLSAPDSSTMTAAILAKKGLGRPTWDGAGRGVHEESWIEGSCGDCGSNRGLVWSAIHGRRFTFVLFCLDVGG